MKKKNGLEMFDSPTSARLTDVLLIPPNKQLLSILGLCENVRTLMHHYCMFTFPLTVVEQFKEYIREEGSDFKKLNWRKHVKQQSELKTYKYVTTQDSRK